MRTQVRRMKNKEKLFAEREARRQKLYYSNDESATSNSPPNSPKSPAHNATKDSPCCTKALTSSVSRPRTKESPVARLRRQASTDSSVSPYCTRALTSSVPRPRTKESPVARLRRQASTDSLVSKDSPYYTRALTSSVSRPRTKESPVARLPRQASTDSSRKEHHLAASSRTNFRIASTPIDPMWLSPPKSAKRSASHESAEHGLPKSSSLRNRNTTPKPSSIKHSSQAPLAATQSDSSDEEYDLLADFRKSKSVKQQSSTTSDDRHNLKTPKASNAQRKPTSSNETRSQPDEGSIEEFTSQNDSIEDFSPSRESTDTSTPANVPQQTRENLDSDKDIARASRSHQRENVRKRPSNIPHNPIAVLNQERQEAAAMTTMNQQIGGSSLWSDSEQEDDDPVEQQNSRRKKGTKRKSRSSTGSTSSTHKKKAPKGKVSAVTSSLESLLESSKSEPWGNLAGRSRTSLNQELHPTMKNPKFGPYPLDPLVLISKDEQQQHRVPAALARYLAPFQQDGVKFLYRSLTDNKGAVLGDDMGCGKTVQVLGLLSALYEKTGTGLDVLRINQRQEDVKAKLLRCRREQEEALQRGELIEPKLALPTPDWYSSFHLPKRWFPVLIVVPSTLIDNWKNEFSQFTHFAVSYYTGATRDAALLQMTHGMTEIMVTSKSLFEREESFQELNEVPWRWKLVCIDEFHTWKGMDSNASTNLRKLKSNHRNLVLGMTGTLMQNDHKELWNLIDLIETNYLGSWEEFNSQVALPIKLARAKTASREAIERSQAKSLALNKKLHELYIERTKEQVLKDLLPQKKEHVVFCELSPLQKQVYEHALNLPDIDLVRKSDGPCDCTVNSAFFVRLQRLKTSAERLAYYRRSKQDLVARKNCCYKIPLNPRRNEGGDQPTIDPDAALWRMMDAHEGSDTGCKRCPTCCGFPALHKLDKIGDHLALIQAEQSAGSSVEGSPEYVEFYKNLEFAKVALPPDVLKEMPGRSLIRKDGIMNDHFALSGKLRVLDKLLMDFSDDNSRVLLFSHSTQTLDLIQSYVRSAGHTHLRMDGKTPTSLRQELANEFNSKQNIFIFLLSTKAMGTGLNLTSANKVIIFDVEWNPSNDEQAQDRAYRIGQERDVQVLRLVARGTLDELKYLRQLYKVQLKQETLVRHGSATPKAARMFRGVQGDKDRKGELFGYQNLLRFKDGCFLHDVWKRNSDREAGDLEIHDASKLSDRLVGMGEDKCEEAWNKNPVVDELVLCATEPGNKVVSDDRSSADSRRPDQPIDGDEELKAQALNHADLFREDRGGAAIEEGDEGFEEEMGGATQNVVAIYEGGQVQIPENPQDGTFEGSENLSETTSDGEGMDDSDLAALNVAPENGTLSGLSQVETAQDVPPTRSNVRRRSGSSFQLQAQQQGATTLRDLRAVRNEHEWVAYSGPKETSDPDTERRGITNTGPLRPPRTISEQKQQNVQLVGLFSNQLDKTAGKTAFSASDLPLPQYRKSKKKDV